MARNDKIFYENAGAGIHDGVWSTGIGGWSNTNYRQITLAEPATGELKTWLEANAVRLPLIGTYVFNNTPTAPSLDVDSKEISSSTSISILFPDYTGTEPLLLTRIEASSDGTISFETYVDGEPNLVDAYSNGTWENSSLRTITFTQPVQYKGNEEFVKWFTANAKPLPAKGKTLNEYTWDEISRISLADKAVEYGFKVGDAKEVTLNGSVGYGSSQATFSNQKYWVYIIGINHNEAKEGKGIAFQGFKTAQTGGIDIAVTSTNYNSTGNGMVMNTTQTNVGGWAGSVAYKTIMPQWKACFSSDLQVVIKSTTLYTDDVGNSSVAASSVKASTNDVYYLAEYEVFGSNHYANTNEPAQQEQYDYYKAGNSKVKYRSDSMDNTVLWGLRSPARSDSSYFCRVNPDGSANTTNAYYSRGSAPCFKV